MSTPYTLHSNALNLFAHSVPTLPQPNMHTFLPKSSNKFLFFSYLFFF